MSAVGTSRLARSFLPAHAVLELTRRCNHRCVFCCSPWEAEPPLPLGPELGVDAWKRCLDLLAASGVESFAFSGGEPLLAPWLGELLDHAAGLQLEKLETEGEELEARPGPPSLYLITNGALVDDGLLDLCVRTGTRLGVSLPGLGTYREHVGVDSGPETALRAIASASGRGIPTTVHTTVTRLNLHELYETLAEGLLAGASAVLLNRFLPGGRGLRHAESLALDAEGIRTMLVTAEAALARAGRWGSVGTELPLCLLPPGLERLSVGTRCAAAVRFFVVGPDGYARVCNHSPVRLAPFDRLAEIRGHPHWRTFALREHLPSMCAGCGRAADCDGGCREAANVVGGSASAPDPIFPSGER